MYAASTRNKLLAHGGQLARQFRIVSLKVETCYDDGKTSKSEACWTKMFANVFLHGMLKQRKSPIHNTSHAACMLLTPSCNMSTDGRRSVPAAEHGQQKKSSLQARPMRFLHWHEKACLVLRRQATRGFHAINLMADALPMHDRGSPSTQRRRPLATQ